MPTEPSPSPAPPDRPPDGTPGDSGATCDYCGSARLKWRKCKLICEACGNINKSCADL